ncbi:hypothetical protein [Pontibacter sp. SGAir0037]|uniref:DUF7793 family protein n=1 Tax=Pontibacter sp. SGAir0037 TaxID=2571030 RepID=UPI0010CD3378|nr:hypothetical protein [Pontibacter sp. SGAir0037]QCR22277.1 hypothetical protein C1N53_07960 [Pontibacter sp. SGAir0037]
MKDLESEKFNKKIETTYSKIEIANGIALCTFKKIEELDVAITSVIVKDRMAFFEGVSYPCLFDITNVKHSTKEARDYLANEGNELVLASAILINSPVIKMTANFFIMVNKPRNPTRMFTDKKSAVEWLEQFKVAV